MSLSIIRREFTNNKVVKKELQSFLSSAQANPFALEAAEVEVEVFVLSLVSDSCRHLLHFFENLQVI